MASVCKSNLQILVDFLKNPAASSYDRQELIRECKKGLEELRHLSSMPRADKGGGVVTTPEAQKTVPVVIELLRRLQAGEDVQALACAEEALKNLAGWF